MIIHTSTFDIESLKNDLEALRNRAPAIIARGLNRAATAGKTAMTRLIVKDTGLQSKYVSREIQLDKANRTQLKAALQIKGSRLPLIAFKARGPEPSRGRGRGVSYRLPSGRGRVSNAFIATMRSGHRGVFKRQTKKRLPIQELRGPSLPHVFEKYLPDFDRVASEALIKNLQHDIDFANRPVEAE
jgi:hypothetical protein